MQIFDGTEPATGNLEKPWINFTGIHRGTVGIPTEKDCGRTAECTSFADDIESADADKIDIDDLSKALAIKRTAPGIEPFGFKMVFHFAYKGLWKVVFQPGFE
jgi:hypothetical protein